MLKLLETLINEHGSSAILRERLLVLKDAYAQVEHARAQLQLENNQLRAALEQEKMRAHQLNTELESLRNGALARFVCDHCGCSDLTRTGSRLDPTFGALGDKQMLFTCNCCGKESAFSPD